MEFSSDIKRDKRFIYNNEKRKSSRSNFSVTIMYPKINSKPLIEISNIENPYLEAVNISEGGICFKSNMDLKIGDFLSFMLKIQDNPSFNCVAEIKWVDLEDEPYLIGCQFYSLSLYQIQAIKEFVSKKYSPTLL